MRNMSFFHTQEQFRNRTKTETTRKGWGDLEPGQVVMGVEKGQGIPKGGKVVRMGPIRCLKNEVVYIDESHFSKQNVINEGFPDLSREEFIKDILIRGCGFDYSEEGNRITFEYVEDTNDNCHAGKDGDCTWKNCPQIKDGEPQKSGRHCPLDKGEGDE